MKDILKNKTYVEDIERIIAKNDLSVFRGKSILITGGLGLICSSVADIFITYDARYNAGIRLYIADINGEFFKVRYGGYSCVEYVPYDATKPVDFDFDVDYIIHGAGLASPELYVSKPVETMTSNFNGVLNLLEFAKSRGAKRTLYVSSSEVYGSKDSDDSFKENRFGSIDINVIRSSYSEAKRASEVLCRSYSSEYGVDTVIVRPGHIYGPTASPRDKRISSEFAYLAAKGEKLTMKSLGLQKRSYCYSLDCAAAMITVLTNGETGESYNIGHDRKTSIREMAEIVAKAGNVILEAETPTEEDLKIFNPMNNSSLDNAKIKAIGYSDEFDVEEGLKHTVKILSEII